MLFTGIDYLGSRQKRLSTIAKKSWKERYTAFKKSAWGLFLIVIVMGGIYSR